MCCCDAWDWMKEDGGDSMGKIVVFNIYLWYSNTFLKVNRLSIKAGN